MDAYDDALKIFVGAAWDKRELILSRMEQLPLRERQGFQAVLTRAGYDVLVPGLTSTGRCSIYPTDIVSPPQIGVARGLRSVSLRHLNDAGADPMGRYR